MAIFYMSYVALWIVVIIQAVLLLLIYRHFGLLQMNTIEGVQHDGLQPGSAAAAFSALTAQGDPIKWIPRDDKFQLVAFVSADCGPCANVFPSIAALGDQSDSIDITLVTRGPAEMAAKLAGVVNQRESITYLADTAGEAYDHYRVRVTPFAFVIGPDEKVKARGLCDGPDKLQALLTTADTGISLGQDAHLIQITPSNGSK